MSNARQKYKDAVADIGCILCLNLGYGKTPAELHHPREDQGMAQRANDYLVIPLCPEHHRGDSGFHGLGKKDFERMYKTTELDLLAQTISLVFKGK